MPRCPVCGSTHIVVEIRPKRRAQCVGCDLQWGLDGPGNRPSSNPEDGTPAYRTQR